MRLAARPVQRLRSAPAAAERRPEAAGRMGDLAAALGDSDRLAAQRRVAGLIAHSPRQLAQRRLADTVHEGPRMALQRQAAEALRDGEGVVQGAFFDTAKIGLELTFQNADSRRYFTNNGVPAGQENNARAWWNRVRGDWAEQANGQSMAGVTKEIDPDAGPNKDFGNATSTMTNTRFSYKPNQQNQGGFTGWWWQLSADPGVVEIQTEPTPGESFDTTNGSTIADIVDMDIFNLADSVDNLTPGGGGGHVNVDFATGFGSNYELIAKTVAETEEVVADLRLNQQAGHPERDMIDFANEPSDPFIDSPREKVPVKRSDNDTLWYSEGQTTKNQGQRYDEWKQKVLPKGKNSEAHFKTFRTAHAEWAFEHPGAQHFRDLNTNQAKFGNRLDEDNTAKVLHYQAINIDHILEENPDARRLEFRFIGAQQSLDEIVTSIRLIERIITQARQRH